MMYDDGMHGDGAAADGTYGVSVPVISPVIHYYIYAENNNAGIFFPQHAEHEYYTLACHPFNENNKVQSKINAYLGMFIL